MSDKERGVALITTLILGFIALIFVGSLMYLLTTGTQMSGVEKTYHTALDAAKGGAGLLMTKILKSGGLRCNNGNPCKSCPISESNTCKIDLDVNNLGGYSIEAYLLNQIKITPSMPIYIIYAFRVKAYKPGTDEKAIIEFVYKVQ